MTAINAYITLDAFKRWKRAGGTDLSADSTDDLVIEDIIEEASRDLDLETGRHFYPIVETRNFDVPENTDDDRVLWLDDDLLAVTTVTNGDDTTLASTEYNLYPANEYPKYSLRIKRSSDYYWERDSSDNREQVIDILGWWGYHDDYGREAWVAGSTLDEGAELTAADLTWTVASAANFEAGQIVKVDSELALVTTVTSGDTDTITVRARGHNGSTAATHDDGSTVYIWEPCRVARAICMDLAHNRYRRRYGDNPEGVATITGAGVVISPAELSRSNYRRLMNLKRVVY